MFDRVGLPGPEKPAPPKTFIGNAFIACVYLADALPTRSRTPRRNTAGADDGWPADESPASVPRTTQDSRENVFAQRFRGNRQAVAAQRSKRSSALMPSTDKPHAPLNDFRKSVRIPDDRVGQFIEQSRQAPRPHQRRQGIRRFRRDCARRLAASLTRGFASPITTPLRRGDDA